MRPVAIVGIGQTPVREHWDAGLRELAVQAVWQALDECQIDTVDVFYVGNMLSGTLTGQEHLATLIAEYAGLTGVEAIKAEAACGSGAAAFRQAVLAVASGAAEVALAVGVEKLTETSTHKTTDGLASAADADYETAMGISFVALNALLMRRYMYEYRYHKSDFSAFIEIAHRNAVHNPNAMFRHLVNRDQYERAKMVADPVNLLDSSPIADGASAVVVTSIDQLKRFPNRPIWVAACEVSTDTIALDNRENPLWLKAAERSVHKAFKTSGLTHRDIQLFELHDAFSIMSALSLEGSGFAERGTAVRLANEGHFAIDGRLPISTFGGLKARGHPVGATGLYQIVEATLQLRGQAPEAIQVPDARIAMTQNIGGSGATIITTILTRERL
ncbi:MAG: thiolase domain-containing protein [Calditrichaeota bacterium]|nr:thiolase domain-containing protein [Calditrichota bacterium]